MKNDATEPLMPKKDESPIDYSKRKYADALKALSEQYEPIVERLEKECLRWKFQDEFDRAKAEKVLHSWRERRVQELEECLRDELMQAKACVSKMRTMPTNSDIGKEAVLAAAVQRITNIERLLLANSDEWREQIRKGANHESDL
jgi:hypothetical protein